MFADDGAVTEANAGGLLFTDDKTVVTAQGSIDYNVRLAMQSRMRPELAYTLASLNGAMAHRLSDRVVCQPGGWQI